MQWTDVRAEREHKRKSSSGWGCVLLRAATEGANRLDQETSEVPIAIVILFGGGEEDKTIN